MKSTIRVLFIAGIDPANDLVFGLKPERLRPLVASGRPAFAIEIAA
jgi:hypothetical protein